jgi:dolichol kinase
MTRRPPLPREEINRKLLHLPALLMPAGIFYLPRLTSMPKWGPSAVLGLLLALSVLLEVLRFAYPAVQRRYRALFDPLLRREEDSRFTGSTYIIAAAFLCALLFMDEPHVAFMTLTAFILADAGAALVGMRLGRIRIGAKSLEGTLACFLIALAAFSLYPRLPLLLEAWEGAMPRAVRFGAPLSIALLELVSLRFGRRFAIDDNLAVPVATGGIILMLHRFFG